MGRKRFRTIILSRKEFEPWCYHMNTDDCIQGTETDDGCRGCQDEMDRASEIIEEQEQAKGYEVLDAFLSNDPWTNQDEDWEFEVTERKIQGV